MRHFKKFQPTKEGYKALAENSILYNGDDIENGVLTASVLKDRDYIRMEQSYKKSLEAK